MRGPVYLARCPAVPAVQQRDSGLGGGFQAEDVDAAAPRVSAQGSDPARVSTSFRNVARTLPSGHPAAPLPSPINTHQGQGPGCWHRGEQRRRSHLPSTVSVPAGAWPRPSAPSSPTWRRVSNTCSRHAQWTSRGVINGISGPVKSGSVRVFLLFRINS